MQEGRGEVAGGGERGVGHRGNIILPIYIL